MLKCKLERVSLKLLRVGNASSNAGTAAMCEVALIKGVKEKGREGSIDKAIEKRFLEGLARCCFREIPFRGRKFEKCKFNEISIEFSDLKRLIFRSLFVVESIFIESLVSIKLGEIIFDVIIILLL